MHKAINKKIAVYILFIGCMQTQCMEENSRGTSTISVCQESLESVCFAEKHKHQVTSILSASSNWDKGVDSIRSLGLKDREWHALLANQSSSGCIVDEVYAYYDSREKTVPKEFVAVQLDTNGSREWVRSYIATKAKAKKRLQQLLLEACRFQHPNNVEMAKKLFAVGISPNYIDPGNIVRDNPGAAGLIEAVSYRDLDLVKLFLEHDADIEIRSPWN